MADDAKLAAFLAWREERSEPTFAFEAFGSTWDMPASRPAELWFWHQELLASGRNLGALTGAEFQKVAVMVVPDEFLVEWLSFPGVLLEDIGLAVGRLISRYLFGDPGEGDDPGEDEPTTTSAPRSSSTSTSSEPTSSASTGSKSKRSRKPSKG